MNDYRAAQIATLTALRDAHIALHPTDTHFPVEVCCWMGSTYFQAWLPVDGIVIDGGMSTFNTVFVRAKEVAIALKDISAEFDTYTWAWDKDTIVEGQAEFPTNTIKPVNAWCEGWDTQLYALECGWCFKG